MGIPDDEAEQRRRGSRMVTAHGSRVPVARLRSSAPPALEAPARSRVCADEAKLGLAEMRSGQSRSVRLRLMAVHEGDKQPTDFFLDVKVFCHGAGRRWEADVKADFGDRVPGAAAVTVLKNRFEATSSLPLVEAGQVVEQEIPLPVDPDTEKLVFWIATDGAGGVPARLACAIRVRAAAVIEPSEDLDTIRLPSIKTVLARNLAPVLRESVDPALVRLGELLEEGTLAGKRALLRRLVETDADLRLIEAGVRDIELAERVADDFGRVDFAALALDDAADAALVVFHAHSSPLLLARTFAASFRRQLAATEGRSREYWRGLAGAAAVALRRRDPAGLDEALRTLRPTPGAAAALDAIAVTALRCADPPPEDLGTSLADYVDDIQHGTRRPPLVAAVEFMAAVGFVALATGIE